MKKHIENTTLKKSFRVKVFLKHIHKSIIFIMRYIAKSCFPKLVSVGTSAMDQKKYKEFCKSAATSDSNFNKFKKGRTFWSLGRLTKDQGQVFLDIIKNDGKSVLRYIPKFKESEIYGNPITFTYDVGDFSPITLRYIKILVDLKRIFGTLDGLDIIEIGAGYGGQCKIISDIFNYKSYAIVDLDEVLLLIRKYLTKLNVPNITYLTCNAPTIAYKRDLVISNYAFSECVRNIQDYYIKTVLKNSKKGYIIYNAESHYSYSKMTKIIHPMLPYNREEIIKILSKYHNLFILDEIPQTGSANFLIVWNEKN